MIELNETPKNHCFHSLNSFTDCIQLNGLYNTRLSLLIFEIKYSRVD